MSPFWHGIFGRWANGIVFALFIAVLTLFGLGPDAWAKFIIAGAPEWVTPHRAQIAFLILALLVLFYAFIVPILRILFDRRRIRRDMDGFEVIDWLVNESVWGWLEYLKFNSRGFVEPFSLSEFKERAEDGKITVRGKGLTGYINEIARDDWRVLRLDEDAFNRKHPPGGRAISSDMLNTNGVEGLLVERHQVKKTWPHAPLWFRLPIRWIVAWRHRRDKAAREQRDKSDGAR